MTKNGTAGVGDPAPDFTLRTADGEAVTLSALRGTQVVIFFAREFT